MRAVQLLFVLTGVAIATLAPFVSVMLRERGLEPAAVGLVLSGSALAFTIAVPIWGHLADVTLGRARTIQVAAIGAAVSMIAFGLPLPAIVLGAMVIAYNAFRSAIDPLVDAVAVGILADRINDYGRIRFLSSLSYGLTLVGIGFVYDRTGFGAAPYFWAASAVLLALGLFFVKEPRNRPPAAVHRRGGSSRAALRLQPRLPFVLLVIGLMYFAMQGASTFFSIRLVEVGGQPSDVALAGGISSLVEIPGILLGARFAKRFGLRVLFMVSAVGYGLCILSWALVDRPPVMIVGRAFSGPAFAGLWVTCVLTMNMLLPQSLQATGQALYQTTAFGIGAMLATATGGVIYQAFGPPVLFVVLASVAFVSAVLCWWAFPRRGESRAPELDALDAGP